MNAFCVCLVRSIANACKYIFFFKRAKYLRTNIYDHLHKIGKHATCFLLLKKGLHVCCIVMSVLECKDDIFL